MSSSTEVRGKTPEIYDFCTFCGSDMSFQSTALEARSRYLGGEVNVDQASIGWTIALPPHMDPPLQTAFRGVRRVQEGGAKRVRGLWKKNPAF